MKSTTIISKLVVPLMTGCLISLALPMNVARADYLVRPVPAQFCECVQCGWYDCTRPHYHKKYHAVHKQQKHYKHHRYYQPYKYSLHYIRTNDFVTFIPGPALLSSRGRWVNPYDCENYDPDMSTGDDDPTIYPGMNIDN